MSYAIDSCMRMCAMASTNSCNSDKKFQTLGAKHPPSSYGFPKRAFSKKMLCTGLDVLSGSDHGLGSTIRKTRMLCSFTLYRPGLVMYIEMRAEHVAELVALC